MTNQTNVKVFLGYGKSKDFQKYPGKVLIEEGHRVYSVPTDFFCSECRNVGCEHCKWTGINIRYRVNTGSFGTTSATTSGKKKELSLSNITTASWGRSSNT